VRKLKQKNKYGCGQTCVAMICGQTEADICGLLDMKGKTHYDDLRLALNAMGINSVHVSLRGTVRKLPKYGIVLLRHKTAKSWGHWIVVQNGKIFDPGLNEGPLTVDEYQKEHMGNIRYVGYLEIVGTNA
jgi:hypothetical protein